MLGWASLSQPGFSQNWADEKNADAERCMLILMSAVETGQLSAAETGQISAVETRQMYGIGTGQSPVPIVDICLVSTVDICPVSSADISISIHHSASAFSIHNQHIMEAATAADFWLRLLAIAGLGSDKIASSMRGGWYKVLDSFALEESSPRHTSVDAIVQNNELHQSDNQTRA